MAQNAWTLSYGFEFENSRTRGWEVGERQVSQASTYHSLAMASLRSLADERDDFKKARESDSERL